MPPKTRSIAPREKYVIAAVLDVFRVLEVLDDLTSAGTRATFTEIVQATGFAENFTFRALRTLEAAGYAVQDRRMWRMSARAARFSDRIFSVLDSQPRTKTTTIIDI
jgi:DNA-binding IclR family transcriptional regulator